MDQVIKFLEDNYFYVAGIGLIIIVILIGFLSSRHKAKKQEEGEEPMANLNEVNTGEIHQVADTIKQNEMKPVDVAPMPTTDALKVDTEPVAPVMEEAKPIVTPPVSPVNNNVVSDKTEVIDLSGINGTPVPNNTVEPVNNAFAPNTTQVPSDGGILNGEETITPPETPKNNNVM
jgi:hypothetical protein